jgi:hypothetical protein
MIRRKRVLKNLPVPGTRIREKIRSETIKRQKQKRENILRIHRRISVPDQHLHPTDFERVKRNINSFDIYFAIGHGQHDPIHSPVQVPENVYVVFTTAPGYLGLLNDSLDEKFLTLLTDKTKAIKFIRGTLNEKDIPDLVKHRKWNWTKHIYPPGSICPYHTLSFFDHRKNEIFGLFDSVCGIHKVPTDTKGIFKGYKKDINEIMDRVKGKNPTILFISGCRGDPTIGTVTEEFLKKINRPFIKPQTYNIPKTQYIKNIEALENSLRKKFTQRRVYDENGIRQQIRKLPSMSKNYINRFVKEYPNFFQGKNLREYFKI